MCYRFFSVNKDVCVCVCVCVCVVALFFKIFTDNFAEMGYRLPGPLATLCL